MMRLFRALADEGKSIICITHNVDNVDRCHLIVDAGPRPAGLLRPAGRGAGLLRRRAAQRGLRPAGREGAGGLGEGVRRVVAAPGVRGEAPLPLRPPSPARCRSPLLRRPAGVERTVRQRPGAGPRPGAAGRAPAPPHLRLAPGARVAGPGRGRAAPVPRADRALRGTAARRPAQPGAAVLAGAAGGDFHPARVRQQALPRSPPRPAARREAAPGRAERGRDGRTAQGAAPDAAEWSNSKRSRCRREATRRRRPPRTSSAPPSGCRNRRCWRRCCAMQNRRRSALQLTCC